MVRPGDMTDRRTQAEQEIEVHARVQRGIVSADRYESLSTHED